MPEIPPSLPVLQFLSQGNISSTTQLGSEERTRPRPIFAVSVLEIYFENW